MKQIQLVGVKKFQEQEVPVPEINDNQVCIDRSKILWYLWV